MHLALAFSGAAGPDRVGRARQPAVMSVRPVDRLVRAAQLGDAGAAEELLALVRPSLVRFAARIAPREPHREDAVQEALQDIAHGLSSYRWQASFLSWCYAICARRVARAAARSAREVRELHDRLSEVVALGEPPYDEPEALLADQDLHLSCAIVVATGLTPGLRRAYLFGDVLGVTDRVGAELCSCSREAFRQRVSRARRAVAGEIRRGLRAHESPIAAPSWVAELDRLVRLGDLHRARGRTADADAAARAAAMIAPTLTSDRGIAR